jgi:hypothetical protein
VNLLGISVTPTLLKFSCTKCTTTHEFSNSEDTWETIKTEKRNTGWTHPHCGLELLCPKCAGRNHNKYVRTGRRRNQPSKLNLEEAIKLFNEGSTLEALAKKYTLSRERVRQKLKGKVNKERPLKRYCRHCRDEITEVNKPPQIFKILESCSKEECLQKSASYHRCDGCQKPIVKTKTGKCQKCQGAKKRTFDYTMMSLLYTKGGTGNQIAEAMGVKPITIYMALRKRSDVEMRPKGIKARHTQEEVNQWYEEEKKRRVCQLSEKS